MRNLVVLFIHFIGTLARLLGPGGVRSLVAESLLLKHQLLIVNRCRQRSPNLSAWDRVLAGWMALLVRPTRLLRSAIVLKPSTLLALHKAMSKRKLSLAKTLGVLSFTPLTMLQACAQAVDFKVGHHFGEGQACFSWLALNSGATAEAKNGSYPTTFLLKRKPRIPK
jgi:hypothetical protein